MTTKYVDGKYLVIIEQLCKVLLTIVKLMRRETHKLRVQVDTTYSHEHPYVTVKKYMGGVNQVTVRYHPKVSPKINLYLFENHNSKAEAIYTKKYIKGQNKNIKQIKNNSRYMRYSLNTITEEVGENK